MPENRRVVLRFVAIFFGLVILFLMPWPSAFARHFCAAFSALANVLVQGTAGMHFEAVPEQLRVPGRPDNSWFVIFFVPNPRTGTAAKLALDLRSFAYASPCVFAALSLASPIWRRVEKRSVFRSRGPMVALVGLGIVGAFAVLSIALPVLAFLGTAPLEAVPLSPFSQSAINTVYRALFYPPGMTYALPVLVWAFAMWLTQPLSAKPVPC